MAKDIKESTSTEESLAFEMIELATDDLSTLARAFDVIDTVCRELQTDLTTVKFESPAHKEIH